MGSCGANRGEFENQSAIKEKLEQIGIRPIRVSHFGHFWRRAKRREKERRRRRRRGGEEEKKERYGDYFCMD